MFFKDGSSTGRVEVHYPIGHRRRRDEGIPVLIEKFKNAIATQFDTAAAAAIVEACSDQAALEAMPVTDFVALWAK